MTTDQPQTEGNNPMTDNMTNVNRSASIHINHPFYVARHGDVIARREGNQIAIGYSFDEGLTLSPLIVINLYSNGAITVDEKWQKAERRKNECQREVINLLRAIGVTKQTFHAIRRAALDKKFSDVGEIAGFIEAIAAGHIRIYGIGEIYKQQLKESLINYHKERKTRRATNLEGASINDD